MSSITTSIYNLFIDYPIPRNNNQEFVCPCCRCTTDGRDRRRWLRHFKRCDPREFKNTSDSIRAINGGLRTIIDDNDQNDSESFDEKMTQLVQAHDKHELNDQQFVAAAKELFYKRKTSSKPSS